ncbi:MAG: hypothetical protein LCH26_08550, partial [Proteobacteria bacterium]|nr:hypothetical protein [Pseudomonadota bacterium]
ALILELLQDTDEHRSVGVLREKNPTTQELISLASLQLPSSFRPCAMRAKDFIPLAAPDPMRLELFLALVEGCPPTDADIISSSLSQSSDIERLRAFRDLNVPPHIRSDLIACYMSQELLHERVPLMLTFLSNYSQKDQQRLCDYYKARLSRLSEEELTFLTKTQLPYAVLDAVFGWCSKISIEQLTIIKAMTEAYEPSNYPYTIDQIFHSSEEIRQLVMTDIYENLQSIKNSSSPASSTQETQKDLDQRSNVG